MFQTLNFRPLPGLASPHLQMLFACYSPPGDEPPSLPFYVRLNDGDQLCCQVSTPEGWQSSHDTIILLHGLGGSHLSTYMIRLARKFFTLGLRVVRVNLRGCGSGFGLNKKTYSSGDSHDILQLLQKLKMETPLSSLIFIGFSLGGNIILKLAGELGQNGSSLLEHVIAVCPPLDLHQTMQTVSKRINRLYEKYYLRQILKQGKDFVKDLIIHSIQEFDEQITVPVWGYKSALDYYQKCSCLSFIPEIRIPCDLIFAADDPFIDHNMLKKSSLCSSTRALLTLKGAHVGFIGRHSKEGSIYWIDEFLLDWYKNRFLSSVAK